MAFLPPIATGDDRDASGKLIGFDMVLPPHVDASGAQQPERRVFVPHTLRIDSGRRYEKLLRKGWVFAVDYDAEQAAKAEKPKGK